MTIYLSLGWIVGVKFCWNTEDPQPLLELFCRNETHLCAVEWIPPPPPLLLLKREIFAILWHCCHDSVTDNGSMHFTGQKPNDYQKTQFVNFLFIMENILLFADCFPLDNIVKCQISFLCVSFVFFKFIFRKTHYFIATVLWIIWIM